MIVDTSAVVAALTNEPDARVYRTRLAESITSSMSAATYLECGIVLDHQPTPNPGRQLDRFLGEAGIEIVPLTASQARLARAAYRDYGRGSGHPARLNFGDCFAYALATEMDEPLLYKGDDFSHTDVRNALGDH